jgi:hypothetical protein
VEGVPSEATTCPAAATQHLAPVTLGDPIDFYETPEISGEPLQEIMQLIRPQTISEQVDEINVVLRGHYAYYGATERTSMTRAVTSLMGQDDPDQSMAQLEPVVAKS